MWSTTTAFTRGASRSQRRWIEALRAVSVWILDPLRSREDFLFEHAGRWMSADERWRALNFLELQRMLLLMYTSCGWFFNDISGIETIQILQYAARALDLMAQLGLPSVRDKFLGILAEAKSNRRVLGTGADIFRRFVEPSNPGHSARPFEAGSSREATAQRASEAGDRP